MASKIEPSKSTLFELLDEILEFEAQLIESEGEITDEAMEAMLLDYFDNKERFKEKIDNYLALIESKRARAQIRKAEAARLTQLQKSDENTADRLESRLKMIMEMQGITEKYSTNRHEISLGYSGGVAPLWIDPNLKATDVEEEFQKPKPPEFDNQKIREYLGKPGNTLEWARILDKEKKVKVR